MSIRLKLLITYIVCVLLSAGILVGSVFLGFGRFLTQVSKIVVEDNTPDAIFIELIDLLADVKQAEKYEPEMLVDSEFIRVIDEKLSGISSSLVVAYKDAFIMADAFSETVLRENLYPRHLNWTEDDHEEVKFVMNGRQYIFVDFSFSIADDPVIYYVLLDVTELLDFNDEVRKGVIGAIILLIVLMTLPLLLLIQGSIIKPLKELDRGAKEIGQGNLEFSLSSSANDEIGKVVRSYERMRQELKAAIERQVQYENDRKALISSISHDLKTPMTSIKGYVEGILDGIANTPKKQEQYLQVIHQKSVDMDRMIDDLFTFSKLDLKKMPFEFAKVDAECFIRDYVQESAIEYRESGTVEMIYIDNSDISPLVSIDRLKMRRVMQNLIQNSFKYNDSKIKAVEISLVNNPTHVQISVKDNGIGMSEEDLKQAFDIFYRSDTSRNTGSGGSGLGLAIVKQIIDEHQGQLKMASTLGKGTKITLILNKEKSDESNQQEDPNRRG